MGLPIIPIRTEPQRVGEVEEALARLFAALAGAAPVEYASTRIGGSPSLTRYAG